MGLLEILFFLTSLTLSPTQLTQRMQTTQQHPLIVFFVSVALLSNLSSLFLSLSLSLSLAPLPTLASVLPVFVGVHECLYEFIISSKRTRQHPKDGSRSGRKRRMCGDIEGL